jgi:hypothetical protein
MAPLVSQREGNARAIAPDERREWVRVNDRLLIEYRVVCQQATAEAPASPPASGEAMLASLRKPTLELLAREGEALANSPLLPWLRKIDWMLEALLASLSQIHPGSVSIAQVTDVNISGGGIEFDVAQPFEKGQTLALKVILPPFTPIQAFAQIIRVTPPPSNETRFRIATQFTSLDGEAHEHLIRHILQTQAEQLRTRRTTTGE